MLYSFKFPVGGRLIAPNTVSGFSSGEYIWQITRHPFPASVVAARSTQYIPESLFPTFEKTVSATSR